MEIHWSKWYLDSPSDIQHSPLTVFQDDLIDHLLNGLNLADDVPGQAVCLHPVDQNIQISDQSCHIIIGHSAFFASV